MTLKKTTIPQLPVATSINNSDYYILQQGSVTKRVQHETVVNTIENRDLNPIEKTYAQMTALVSASGLISGAKYLITDATTANIPLLVEAISTTAIHTDAKNSDFPQDVIEYDFDNDIIKWRWDTINDISTAQDLRNLQGLTIGSGGNNIHLGPNCTGSIANNVTDITFGRSSSFIIPINTRSIQAGNFCVYENTISSQELVIFDYAEVRANAGISKVTFRASFNGITSSNPTPVYNNSGSVQLSDDPTIFSYFIGTTLTVEAVD